MVIPSRLLPKSGLILLALSLAACGNIIGGVIETNSASFNLSIFGASSQGTGTCRMFIVKNLDGNSNATPASAMITANLTGKGSGNFYSDPGCTSPTTTATISLGKMFGVFYFKDAVVESLNFKATSSVSNSPTLALNSIAGGAAAWSNLTGGLAASPPPLISQTAVFHWMRNSILLYGGWTNASTTSSDMWEFVGTTWNQICTGCAPGQRSLMAMVYDINRNIVVMFGGGLSQTAPGSFLNDVWEWDGTNWTQRTNILGTAPSKRGQVFSAYDSNRGRMIIFGGQDTTGTDLNDLYEYDGVSWFHPTPGGPPSVRSTVAGPGGSAYDPIHQHFLVYGGFHGGTYYDDIYSWDGTNWTAASCNPNCTGTGRDGAQADFDSSRDKFVIAQGFNGGEVAGSWEVDGAAFTHPAPLLTDPGDPGNARDSGTLAYNPFTGVMIYFGGNTCGAGCNFNETWQYSAP